MSRPVSRRSSLPRVVRPRTLELFGPRRPSFTLAGEALAGLTVGLIALPLALALGIASIPAGVATPLPPPALGILTAILAGATVSLLGGSRVQIAGPTAAFVPIILLIVTDHGYAGLLVATLMAGGILVLMGLTGMGTLIKFIPWPVTSGFTTGIAVAILLSQVPDFAGLAPDPAAPREMVHRIPWLLERLPEANLYALGVAAALVVLIVLWPRLRLRFLPGSVVALLAATVFVAWTGWGESHGVATIGSRFGPQAIPSSLPAPTLPWAALGEIDLGTLRELLGPALAIALLGAIESLLSAVVADGLSGDRHDSNTELVAQGVANLLCPFFGGLPSTGAIARTSANVNNGGRTPLAGLVHALTLLAVVFLASGWARHVPMAAVSAVLVVVALRMGEWHELTRLRKMPASDALVLLATFSLTVVFDLVVAVEVGMVLAAFLFIRRVSETTEVSLVQGDDALEPPEQVAQGKDVPAGVLVYRIFGPFLFGAAEKLEDALQRVEEWPQGLILRLNLVTAMDATGLNALESIVERMHHRGGTVILSGLHRQPQELLRKAGFLKVLGPENLCPNFDAALRRARQVVGE